MNETLKTLQSLRSIHWQFNEKPVSREDIETIVEHSLRAANSDNLTDYSVIAVTDPRNSKPAYGRGVRRPGPDLSCLCD